jgi:hypothetical protein
MLEVSKHMTGFRTYPGEKIIYQDGGVATFELSTNPIYGEGILTNRRFVHKLSPVFNPQVYFVTPGGVDLEIQLHEIQAFDVEDDTFIIQTTEIKQIRIKVKDPQDWLQAWQRGLTELHGTPPLESSSGKWQVVERSGDEG